MQIASAPQLKFRPGAWTFSPQVMYDGKVRAGSARFTGGELNQQDGLLLGDLRQQTLAEIWSGRPMRELRRSFARGTIPPVCQTCTLYRSV